MSRLRSSGRNGPRLHGAGDLVIGQFIEGNVLAPKLVGESVGIHPVWLIFALLAFGYLFGFVGLLVAVPLAATIGVLARFALKHTWRVRFIRAERTERMEAAASLQLRARAGHAESFAREDFIAGPSNAAALALIDRWPTGRAGLLRSLVKRARARAISPRLGREIRRALSFRPLLETPTLPAALSTVALVIEDLTPPGSTM